VTSNLEMFVGVAKKPQHLGAADRGEHRQAAGASTQGRPVKAHPTLLLFDALALTVQGAEPS
jgi:hypothetical protein